MSAIGVLDLQGGVAEHLGHLAHLGIPALRVKKAADFASLAGLIIPGGESTCLSRLLRIEGLDLVIQERCAEGRLKLWGTCAGAILLAKRVLGEPAHLALLDIDLTRNAFGSQIDSFNTLAKIPKIAQEALPLTFIRAPKITRLGSGVECLLAIDDYCAAAEDARILVTVFHPELTPNPAFHRYFAAKCGLSAQTPVNSRLGSADWVRHARIP